MQPPDGFAEFVATRSPALLRTAWLLTGDRDLAQDLVQDALARAWRAWGSIRRTDQPEAYVRQVMVNTSITWGRRRWRGERPTERVPERAASTDPAAEVDTRDELRRALAGLPPRQRATVVLRFVEDLSEAQTAQLLGCSVGTVKSQTARALARLRELLPPGHGTGGTP